MFHNKATVIIKSSINSGKTTQKCLDQFRNNSGRFLDTPNFARFSGVGKQMIGGDEATRQTHPATVSMWCVMWHLKEHWLRQFSTTRSCDSNSVGYH